MASGIRDNLLDYRRNSPAAPRLNSHIVERFHIEILLQSLFQPADFPDQPVIFTAHHGKALAAQAIRRVNGHPIPKMNTEQNRRQVVRRNEAICK